ncbi:MAG: hypothetical protein M3P38_08985 [Chloroflexota bacterium]|nr:hypothetical protein [Chloroflexota bacterium]
MSRPETHLALMGDWGVANFHLASGWIANGLRYRTAPSSTFVIHALGPYATMLGALIDRTVDIAFAQALVGARWARAGMRPFHEAHPELVALGVLPHRDRVLLALPETTAARVGVRSFADLRTRQPPLRLTVGARDGLVGAAAEALLEAHGIGWDDIPRWGGEWVFVERPQPAIGLVAEGKADGVLFEGIMNWYATNARMPLRVLIPETAAWPRLEAAALERGALDVGEFASIHAAAHVVDFSGWVAMARSDMSDDVAHLIARVLVEDREILESRYRGKDVRESALSYPIVPSDLPRTKDVPLHPGAASYYREAGLL